MKVRHLHTNSQYTAFLKEKEFIKQLIVSKELAAKEWDSLSEEEQVDCTNSNFADLLDQENANEIDLCKKRIEKNKHKFCTKFQLKKYIRHLGMENFYSLLFTKLAKYD